MKTKILLITLFGFFALTAYGKYLEADKKQRIKEFILNYGEDKNDQKKVFSYERERLVLIRSFIKDESGNWIESSKDSIIYSGENITCTEYLLEDGVYQKYAKVNFSLEKNRIVQEVCSRYYENRWIEHWRTDYQYVGNDLKQWIFYLDYRFNGTMVPYIKADYIYEEGKAKEILHSKNQSGSWQINQKDSFTYSGSELIAFIRYNSGPANSWYEKYRDTLSFENDAINRSSRTYRHPANAGFINTYKYDKNGNSNTKTQSDGGTISYQYEEGIGNAEYFFYAPEDYFTGPPRLKTIGMGAPEVAPNIKAIDTGKNSLSEVF